MLGNSGISRLRIAAALLAMLMLSGCTLQPQQTLPTETTSPTTLSPETTQTEETQPPQTEPPETDPPETTAPTEPLPEMEPVIKLKSTRWRTFPETLSLGGGIVLASRNYYSPEQDAIVNSMELVDVYADAVIHKIENDSPKELVQQRFEDGCFAAADPKSNSFYIYDGQLQTVEQFTAPNVEGFFSGDRKNYYFVDSGVLCRMDVATGNYGRMMLEWDLRLESLLAVHPEQTLLVARFYLSPFTTDYGLAVVDVSNGEIKLLTDDYTHVWLADDSFYGMRMNEDGLYGYDVYYGSLKGGQIQRISTDQLNLERMNYKMLDGSHWLLCKAAADGDYGTALRDMVSGQVCDLSEFGFEGSALGCIYLPEEQLIFGFYENGYDFDPIVFAPRSLTFTGSVTPEAVDGAVQVDTALAQAYLAQVKGAELPKNLADIRTAADALEKKYGVTVLLGEQVTDTCTYADYSVQTVEDIAALESALKLLDAEFARYPEGFLKQFRNGAQEGGIIFCLTGAIEGELAPTGFAVKQRDRYSLALDITAAGLQATIHHEIWHAIEMKLSTDTFDTKEWTQCNPAGFSYYGKYDAGYQDLTRWTYSGGSGADSFFVDPYSRINAREDRARIWEKVMSTDAAELLTADAIGNKLQIMSDAIRQKFDSNQWTQPLWEQNLITE